MIRLISWNMNGNPNSWSELVNSDIDLALLQEAKPPPESMTSVVPDPKTPWFTAGGIRRNWCTAVACFSDKINIKPYKLGTVSEYDPNSLPVSCKGTLAAADVVIESTKEVITFISMYGAWEEPLKNIKSSWIYADASVHRLISDISVLIGKQRGHKIIAAGDLNVLYGYGEHGSSYWKARYDTVFNRFEAIGLPFIGPQATEGGIQADPWPEELPKNSKDVPTYRTQKNKPETATRQLDFVFASDSLKNRLNIRAMNKPEEWGPSDHCRILIELDEK